MTISEACEIQFWPAGQQSFNTKTEGWTDKYCYNQNFLCTQTRRLQVLGGADEDIELRLSILENGVEIESLDFIQTNNEIPGEPGIPEIPGVESAITIPELSSWENVTGDEVYWTEGANPTIELVGSLQLQSNNIVAEFDFIPGYTYKITSNVDFERETPVGGTLRFVVLDSFNEIVLVESQNTPFGSFSGTLTKDWIFLAGEDFKKLGFYVTKNSGIGSVFNLDFEIVSVTGTQTTPVTPAVPESDPIPPTYYLNSISFNPYDLELCDKVLSFKVFTVPVDPEEIFYSDEIHFVSEWLNAPASGLINIQYRSINNFAGLIYNSESPYFSIDLEGRFRKQKVITAQKTLELTNIVLNTAASVKRQKLLVIDDVADYMHTKINLILAHAASGSVLVNGEEITVEEGYEEGDRPGSYPLSPAEIFLTIKNFYKHNVI